jgi:hypothetical protein
MRLWSKIRLSAAAAVVFGVMLATSPARADVFWSLNNLQFVLGDNSPDGGTLNGTFAIDQYGYFLNGSVNISTTNGSALFGDTYTGVYNSFVNPPADTVTIFLSDTSGYQRYIQLTFANPLTVPGIDPIIGGPGGPSYECFGWGCPDGAIRYISSDSVAVSLSSVSPVPEAATWAMMLLGFLGLGVLAYRRSGPAHVRLV